MYGRFDAPPCEAFPSDRKYVEAMPEQLAWLRITLGAFMLVAGGLGIVYPYKVARIGEIIDAIGSTRSLNTVEPVGWKVSLTRITSFILALVGLWWIILGFGGV
jgi:hypothetical protein